eukprot:gene21266-biopygen5655
MYGVGAPSCSAGAAPAWRRRPPSRGICLGLGPQLHGPAPPAWRRRPSPPPICP